MAKTYRSYLPEQDLLLPPSLREWLPDDHLVYFVSDVVDQLNLSAIESVYEEDDRGQPPYHPRMMTKILLYGYCVGVFVAQDPEAFGGRRCLSCVGGRESTRFPDHLGFSEATPEGAGRAVPADVTADAGDGDDKAGAGGAGWE